VIVCGTCGKELPNPGAHAGDTGYHRPHSNAELARLRARVDAAATPLFLAALGFVFGTPVAMLHDSRTTITSAGRGPSDQADVLAGDAPSVGAAS
jgi:hypothetical protein